MSLFYISKRIINRFSPPFRSVCAAHYVDKGTMVPITGAILGRPTQYTIQICKNQHILDQLGVAVNHSCVPTSKVVTTDSGAFFQVIKAISPGEELTFNYFDSEKLPLYSGFVCNDCNHFVTEKCRKSESIFDDLTFFTGC